MSNDATFRERYETKMAALRALANKHTQSAQNARAEARATDGEVNLGSLICSYELAILHAEFARELADQAESMYFDIRFREGFDAATMVAEVDADMQARSVPEFPPVGRFTFGDIVTAYESRDVDREHQLVVEIADPYDAGSSEMQRQLLSASPKGTIYAYSYEADSDGEPLKVMRTISLTGIGTSDQDQRHELTSLRTRWENR